MAPAVSLPLRTGAAGAPRERSRGAARAGLRALLVRSVGRGLRMVPGAPERWPGLRRLRRDGADEATSVRDTARRGARRVRTPLGLLPAAGALTSAVLLVLLVPALLPASPERADAAQAPAERAAPAPAERAAAPERPPGSFGPPREAEVVRALRAWREALAQRAREVEADRTAALALVERIDARIAELDDRIGRLAALREEIRGLLGEVEAREKERIERLVRVYEGMKPKQAARIFDELEMDTLLPIARRMRPARLAVILQSMRPERARELTRRLSERPELPDLSPLGPLGEASGANAGG